MLDSSQNIFRRIIRETCTVYKEKVKRELVTMGADGNATPTDSPQYQMLLQETQLDWKMAEAHRLAKAAWLCFLRVRTLETTGEMRIELITPDMSHVDLDRDDPLKMKGFGYFVEGVDKRKNKIECWVYYTDDEIRYLDNSGRQIENPFSDNYDTTNPYGVIPVVPFFATAPTHCFWDLKWNYDAMRANYIIGVLNTYMNYLVKVQSFKQVVFSGKVTEDVLNAISDPSYPFVLPAGATAATLDLNTQLAAIDSVIRGKVMAIANNYGISNENFNITGNAASGFSLRVANRALEEIRSADKTVALETEKHLFDLMRIVNNTDGGEDIPEDLELKWNPGEIEYPPSMAEDQSKWEFEFKYAIKNPIDYLMAQDPELSREDAMEMLQQVKTENGAVKPATNILESLFGSGNGQGAPLGNKS